MIHATMMGHFSGGVPNERGKIACPDCGGWMSEGASRCNSCQATLRGQERSERWLELHEAGMFEWHQLFRAAMEAGYTIQELHAMKTALLVEGREYCRIGGQREI